MKKDYNKKRNISHTEGERGITYDFCNENSKECLKRNKFYKEIRKKLVQRKLKKHFKNKL